MPIIAGMTGVRCQQCQTEKACGDVSQAEDCGWYVKFAGSPHEGNAIVLCPKCRTMETWILSHDAQRLMSKMPTER